MKPLYGVQLYTLPSPFPFPPSHQRELMVPHSTNTYIPRVPQCLSPRPNWDPPHPLPSAGVSPPGTKKGTHSLVG